MTQERFKKCPSCQNFVPEPATVCMYCGAAQQAQKVKKKGGLGKILLWLVMAFFGCIVLSVVASFFVDDAPATSSVTPSAPANALVQIVPTWTPTSAVINDPIPVATDTPILVAIVNTPIPTATNTPIPIPTDTPVPPTVDSNWIMRQVYLAGVAESAESIATGLERFGPLFTNPRIGQDDWTIQVAAAIATIRLGHEKMTELSPPPDLVDLHFRIIDATGDCSEATDYMARGIDNIDASALEESVRLLGTCTQKVRALNGQIPIQ